MKKILIRSTLKFFLIFLLIFGLNVISYIYWSYNLGKIKTQIKEVILENKKNQDTIAHYSQLLNERAVVENKIDKIKSLFFLPDDIFHLKDKIIALGILNNLFLQINYQINEKDKEIKFSLTIPVENDFKSKTKNILSFLKALEKKYLTKIDKIEFNNYSFNIYGTFYFLP